MTRHPQPLGLFFSRFPQGNQAYCIASIAVMATLLGGCGPVLQEVERSSVAFRVDPDCSQGPLELRGSALGNRWGEHWILTLQTPRAALGQFEAKLPDRLLTAGSWATQHSETVSTSSGSTGQPQLQWVADTAPDNGRCTLRPVVVPSRQVPEFPQNSPPPVEPPRQPDLPGPPTNAPPTNTPQPTGTTAPPGQNPAVGQAILVVDAMGSGGGTKRAPILDLSWQNQDLDAAAPMPAGTAFHVRLWSKDPNDFQGAVFVLRQLAWVPSVAEEQWLVYLRQQRQEQLLEQEKQAKSARSTVDIQRSSSRNSQPQVDPDRPLPDNDGPWPGLQQPPAQKQPQPHEPSGAPPVALTETPPPQPSVHAAWQPGWWLWTGFDWYWLGGWWRVPDVDLQAQATVQAPQAPPPPQVEVRSNQPFGMAIWLTGYWSWTGAIWLWIPGRWQIAPDPGAHWQPPVWLPHGAGVRLQPGRWMRIPL